MRRGEQRLIFQTKLSFALKHVTTGAIMKLGRRHRLLKLMRFDHAAKERVGVEQH